jgi:hypothetical protein
VLEPPLHAPLPRPPRAMECNEIKDGMMVLRYSHDAFDVVTLGAEAEERASESSRDDIPTPVEDADCRLGDIGERD